MTDTTHSIALCTKCNEYFGSTEGLCSVCYAKTHPDARNLFREDLSGRLPELFREFQLLNGLSFRVLKSNAMLNVLMAIARNKDMGCGHLVATLHGLNDLPPTVLMAKDATRVLEAAAETHGHDDDFYLYLHAIYPIVLDVWNLVYDNAGRVGACYYRDFGDLTVCPSKKERLFQLWSRMMRKDAMGGWSGRVGECVICTDTIHLTGDSARCTACSKIMHSSCLRKWFDARGEGTVPQCPLCRAEHSFRRDEDDE
jgi:hypothetical protein